MFLVFILFALILTSCNGKDADKQQDAGDNVIGENTALTGKDLSERQNGMQVINFSNSNILMDMAVDEKSKEGNIYVADKENTYIYNDESGKWDTIVDNLKLCRIIGIEVDKIFALDDGSLTLKYFDNKGTLIKEYPVDKGYGQKILCIGDKVFLHFVNSKSGNWYIAVYDINTGEKTMLELEDIRSFTRYGKDSILLVRNSYEDKFVIYNIKENGSCRKVRLENFFTESDGCLP